MNIYINQHEAQENPLDGSSDIKVREESVSHLK